MAVFAVHVVTDIDRVDDDRLDEVVDAVRPWHGVPALLGGRLSLQLTVEAASAAAAQEAALAAVSTTVLHVVAGHVIKVEVSTP